MFLLNILWDFDGTLFNTYPAYTNAFSSVLGEAIDKEEIYRNLKISYSHAIEHYNIAQEKGAEIKSLIKKLLPQDLRPFNHVEKILQYANKNVIMTHKHREGVLAILQYYGWDKYFSDMVTIDDGFPRKPDCAAYKYLHEKHRIDLVIGDRELDLQPAKDLGIATCMYQGESSIADYHIQNYDDFFKLDFLGR
ncbi:haloacid dehalogenase superfamily, subfamily IA, variant 1 with third motif having Dx(3-4)D or Dx(3-4)E [Terribacillus halophilus]|uniref:Haloacid dehalogenase superfamily, subfamily IA, variant 1 with third motif having Dx(3-4)D or Dx(3-4)E n=1 Tax=Terribacillus halophilus TaxID=361279 RepID=A0A1G6PPK8_9BACI|nr:haloacid dehalogenase superfamily, subfamily IA, variant 1 with third motif having Dx(3-4)D or Dx(3-4)E [Terribacillus halophilus]